MSIILKTLSVTARVSNTYPDQNTIKVDKDYRVKKNFVFQSSIEENDRYFIDLTDNLSAFGKSVVSRWIPKSVCYVIETVEIPDEDKAPDGTTKCNSILEVISPISLSSSMRGSCYISEDYSKGSIIECDLKAIVVINGDYQIRYRISDSDNSIDIGKWVILNSSVSIIYNDEINKVKVESYRDEELPVYNFRTRAKASASSWQTVSGYKESTVSDKTLENIKNSASKYEGQVITGSGVNMSGSGFSKSSASAYPKIGSNITEEMWQQVKNSSILDNKVGTTNNGKTAIYVGNYTGDTSAGGVFMFSVTYQNAHRTGNPVASEIISPIDDYFDPNTNKHTNTAKLARSELGIPLDWTGDLDEGRKVKANLTEEDIPLGLKYRTDTVENTMSNLTVDSDTGKSSNDPQEVIIPESTESGSAAGSSSTTPAQTSDFDESQFGGGDESLDYDNMKFIGDDEEVKESLNILKQIYDTKYTTTSFMGQPLERMGFVHGLPFQFSPLADRRYGSNNTAGTGGDSYGMVYARDILANVPIVVFAPGRPHFLTKIKGGVFSTLFGSGEERTSIKDKWMPLLGGTPSENTVEHALLELRNDGGQYDYYTMNIDTADYFDYVNMICKTSARNMGLTYDLDLPAGQKNPIHLNWDRYNVDIDVNCTQDSLMSVLGMNSGVAFAFDPQSSVTDSLTNSTTESQLVGMLNQLSSSRRELGFLMGAAAGKDGFTKQDWDKVAASYKEGFTGGHLPILDSISRYIGNIGNGLTVRFPEIWNDSSISKSYSVDMHFISPYANKLSIWRHVLVPFWHIFCLAAPQSKVSINTYDSPFLIRAFSKGYFNVEMGIIESLSYKRFGDGSMITANGIPSQIDVTADFKDLYHMLAITPYKWHRMALFFNNTGLLDLIGTLSGVNMNRMGLGERLSLYMYAAIEDVRDIGATLRRHILDRTRRIADKFWYGTV